MSVTAGAFRGRVAVVAALAAVVLGGSSSFGSPGPPTATSPAAASRPGSHEHRGAGGEIDINVCPDAVGPGSATCTARVRTEPDARNRRPGGPGQPSPAGTYGNNGAYDPGYLQSAYNAPSAAKGLSQTVAIVDAFDNPNAESDLAAYRSAFGLAACTTANGCFRKVDQRGASTYPPADPAWAQEIALDVDMVSALCPNCHIVLVEADSASQTALGLAVNEAVALGANVVSSSYAGPEFSSETSYTAAYYTHPGVAMVASSGDNGYGVNFPAASAQVVAVGGTSLIQNTGTGTRDGSETAWSGAGSGCSGYEPKPAWQHDASCANRTVSDVSAVADPNTGVWVYDSYSTSSPWLIFGGTSVAAPVVGALYALAGNAKSSTQPASFPYANRASLNDVVAGSNGACSPPYLCQAGPGYDGPTGLGTPNTAAGLSSAAPPAAGAPTAPLGLAATAGDRTVKLTWSVPSSKGSGTLTYNIYRGTTAGGETLVAGGLAATGSTDSGLTDGTTYYYRVTATNPAGEGPASNEVSARPFGPPGAPQALTAVPASPRGIGLAWQAPASNGGSTITGYKIYRGRTAGSMSLYTTSSCSSSSCGYADTSPHRILYYYQVAAVNSTGIGPMSNQASAVGS